MTDQKEKYASQKLNSKALMKTYRQVAEKNHDLDEEFGAEMMVDTHAQIMDAYREGTIDDQASPTTSPNK